MCLNFFHSIQSIYHSLFSHPLPPTSRPGPTVYSVMKMFQIWPILSCQEERIHWNYIQRVLQPWKLQNYIPINDWVNYLTDWLVAPQKNMRNCTDWAHCLQIDSETWIESLCLLTTYVYCTTTQRELGLSSFFTFKSRKVSVWVGHFSKLGM